LAAECSNSDTATKRAGNAGVFPVFGLHAELAELAERFD
jgi:hypothetical protein